MRRTFKLPLWTRTTWTLIAVIFPFKRLEEVGEDSEEPYENSYIINQNKNIPQIWEFIMNVFTIYSLAATPLM